MTETTKQILSEIYKDREKETYFRKYDAGLVVVIGGGDFYSGSPALSAMAAFRAGADMVRILAPERAANIIASFSPNLAAFPLPRCLLCQEHLPILLAMTESARIVSRGNVSVVIGGGAGRSEETQETLAEYINSIEIPLVVDADAIYALAQRMDVAKGKEILVTPHVFEFFVLTGREVHNLKEEEKIKVAKEEAARLGLTILLKGKTDIITDGKEVALNDTGTPYMSVGGTGDTLAGICGAMAARGADLFKAGQAAAYINGKAGEAASARLKDSMLATDLIDAIPEVINFNM